MAKSFYIASHCEMPIGTGMSSLAIYLHKMGLCVIGSDNSTYYFTEDSLKDNNISYFEYNEKNINSSNDYIYIIGMSIDRANVEFKKVIDLNLDYYYYNDFVGNNIGKKMIAVSGTHGKTTTCKMLSIISGYSCIIGSSEAIYNDSDYVIVEACEYKEHFLSYNPRILIICNIDYDHPDYFKSKKSTLSSFQKIANKSLCVLINGDYKLCRKIKHYNKYTFGLNSNNNYVIKILKKNNDGYMILLKGNNICRIIKANVFGLVNLYNFVAAFIATILSSGSPRLINCIDMPKRRQTEYIYNSNIIIDDYAHHPNEIKSLYEILNMKYCNMKMNVLFQPHTYSRTIKYIKDFVNSLSLFSVVYIMDVFTSSREEYNKEKQRKIDKYFKKFNKYDNNVLDILNCSNNSIWIFLGAGNQNSIIKTILDNNIMKK